MLSKFYTVITNPHSSTLTYIIFLSFNSQIFFFLLITILILINKFKRPNGFHNRNITQQQEDGSGTHARASSFHLNPRSLTRTDIGRAHVTNFLAENKLHSTQFGDEDLSEPMTPLMGVDLKQNNDFACTEKGVLLVLYKVA